MAKGQGSLEYLLILAAILAIAVVVIVVANSMIGAPQTTAQLTKDKYEASVVGAELVGYDKLYDGNADTLPAAIKYKGSTYSGGQLVIISTANYDAAAAAGGVTTLFSLGATPKRVGYVANYGGYTDAIIVEGNAAGINPPHGGGGSD